MFLDRQHHVFAPAALALGSLLAWSTVHAAPNDGVQSIDAPFDPLSRDLELNSWRGDKPADPDPQPQPLGGQAKA